MSAFSFKKCFAIGCEATIPRHLLMCRGHWLQVPPGIRDQVGETWADFERGGKGTLRPYALATLRAQLAVADREARLEDAKAIRTRIIRIEQKEAI